MPLLSARAHGYYRRLCAEQGPALRGVALPPIRSSSHFFGKLVLALVLLWLPETKMAVFRTQNILIDVDFFFFTGVFRVSLAQLFKSPLVRALTVRPLLIQPP